MQEKKQPNIETNVDLGEEPFGPLTGTVESLRKQLPITPTKFRRKSRSPKDLQRKEGNQVPNDLVLSFLEKYLR